MKDRQISRPLWTLWRALPPLWAYQSAVPKKVKRIRGYVDLAMSKTIVAGIPGVLPRLEDVVAVAKGASVELDQNTAARIKKESPQPSAFRAEEQTAEASSSGEEEASSLSSEQTRATAFVLLLTIVNGKTKVRLKVVEKLLALLDAGEMSIRAPARNDTILTEVVHLITKPVHGEGVPISTEERAVLTTGQLPAAALGALTVVASKHLQRAALAVAALTCEAIQADVKDFDTERVESLCSREAIEVASEMRDLLNESVRINVRKGGPGPLECISLVPSVHGELEASIRRCEQLVSSVVRSAPSDPAITARLGPAIGLSTALMQLSGLLIWASQLSLERMDKVRKTVNGNGAWIAAEVTALEGCLGEVVSQRQSAQEAAACMTGHACFLSASTAMAASDVLLTALSLEAAILVLSLREQGIMIRNGVMVVGEPGEYTETRKKKTKGKGGGDPDREFSIPPTPPIGSPAPACTGTFC